MTDYILCFFNKARELKNCYQNQPQKIEFSTFSNGGMPPESLPQYNMLYYLYQKVT